MTMICDALIAMPGPRRFFIIVSMALHWRVIFATLFANHNRETIQPLIGVGLAIGQPGSDNGLSGGKVVRMQRPEAGEGPGKPAFGDFGKGAASQWRQISRPTRLRVPVPGDRRRVFGGWVECLRPTLPAERIDPVAQTGDLRT